MRHRIKKRHLNRDTKHRKALFKNLLRALITHGEITTTEAKAKEVKRIGDKIVFKAINNDLKTRRLLHRFFGRRDVVNTLVDRIAPEMKSRVGGYTRITKIGKRRGDNALLVNLSLVNKPEKLKTLKSGKEYPNTKSSVVKAKVSKGKKKVVKKAKPKKELKKKIDK